MVVVLFRHPDGIKIEKRAIYYVREVVGKKARIVSVGYSEPVDDGGTGNNSPFAPPYSKPSRGRVLTARLFKQIRRPVQLNADQTPVFADIRKAGHGDFLFVKRK